MKHKISPFFCIFLCLAFLAGNFVFGPAVLSEKSEYSEILVKFKGNDNLEVVSLGAKDDLYAMLEYYSQMPEVEYAEPNFIYRISSIPSDPFFEKQWYLKKIKASQAWEYNQSSPGIVVAVIDAGIQIDHPDLKENIWRNQNEIAGNNTDDDKNGFMDDVHGWDFITNTPDPSPKFSEGFTEAGVLHGTIVAGVLAAQGNNNIGVTGVTWKTQIMPLRVLDDRGQGKVSDVVRAIDYAVNNGADIINLSFVGFDYSRGMYEAIKRAYDAGVFVVAAAGNELDVGHGYNLDATPMYPVCMDGDDGENMVIGVSATDELDQKTAFSSYGFKCVDISAPGVKIFSTSVYAPDQSLNGRRFYDYYEGYWSGTSLAAPMISGAIALIKQSNPGLTSARIRDILFSSVDNINRLNPDYMGKLGSGRLNLERALILATEELEAVSTMVLIAPQSKMESQIKISDSRGEEEGEFFAYQPEFLGGASIASGDLDGDGTSEIITGAGPGGGPHVRIFDMYGNVKGQFFAYHPDFRGGVSVAVGDLDGDGTSEIITGAGPGGGPHVRIFDMHGNVKGQFFAYNPGFRGGVSVAVGDLDGDGTSEIITGAGPGGGPHVRIFDMRGNVKGQFFAYRPDFRGGVSVATGNIEKLGRISQDEIITGAGPGGGPHVRIFDARGNALGGFFAYEKNFKGGVNVATGDFSRNGFDEIITGAGITGGPHVRIFNYQGILQSSFYAYDRYFAGGINVGSFRVR